MNATKSTILIILFTIINNCLSKTILLTILHSNGNFADDDNGFGGIPKTLRLIKRIKATSTKNNPVIYLNAGDIFRYKTDIAADFVKLTQPDAFALGNHEFDEGLDGLRNFCDKINQTLLCANGDFSQEVNIKRCIKPSVIINGTLQIGVVGYINSKIGSLKNVGGIKFFDEIEAVRKEVGVLKSKGVKVIIALGHSGIEIDKKIARDIDGVDAVIGGDSHTFLYTGNPTTNKDEVYSDFPVVIRNLNGVEIPVVGGKYLGVLNLTLDLEGNVLKFSGEPLILGDEISDNEAALGLLNVDRSTSKLKNEVVGISRVFLQGGYHCRLNECNFGNLMTDAFCEYKADKFDGSNYFWTDSPIALVNAGTFTSSINCTKQEGNITISDLYRALPFGDKLVTLRLNTSILLQILEQSVKSNGETLYGEFLQVSGLKVVYDMNKKSNRRVVDVLVRCSECDVPYFEPIKSNLSYSVITNSFLANGGDGYGFLRGNELERIDEEVTALDVVKKYIGLSGIVQANLENRITMIRKRNCGGNLRNNFFYNLILIIVLIQNCVMKECF